MSLLCLPFELLFQMASYYRVTVSNGELPIELLYQMASDLSSYCIKWRVTYQVTISNGELPIELLYQMASYLSSYCVKWLNVGKVIWALLPTHNSRDEIRINLWQIFLFSSCKTICLGNFVSIKQNADDCGWFMENVDESSEMRVSPSRCGWLRIYAVIVTIKILMHQIYLTGWLRKALDHRMFLPNFLEKI